jgi:hypothetical protein
MYLSPDERTEKFIEKLPELVQILNLADSASGIADIAVESTVVAGKWEFPLLSFTFGTKAADAPVLVVVGGVHGLERIGSNLAASFIKNMIESFAWDDAFRFVLERCRICVYPLVNPAGMFFKRRSNMNGVDLMRNAPLDAVEKPVRLVGGHRISPNLPWFRGMEGAGLEHEAETLLSFVRGKVARAPFSTIIDLHSGFGVKDRIWFPYAYSSRPFRWVGVAHALKHRLDRCLPNHIYLMEPQSKTYITHGDLWDYLTLEHEQRSSVAPMLPLTLEMGSWTWVRKNPRQIFSSLGIFNPVLPHRIQRTLRRHVTLLEFLMRATASWERWSDIQSSSRGLHSESALRLWYPNFAETNTLPVEP